MSIISKICPLCGSHKKDADNICDTCKNQISAEMFKLKESFGNSYEFNIAVIDWLEREA